MKRFLQIFLVISLLLSSFQLTPSVQADDEFKSTAKSALVFEETTGKILYEKNTDELIGIASISKLLTAYIIYDAIEAGELDWQTKIPISDKAYQLTSDLNASNVPMEEREYTVKDLMHAMLLASANSAVLAFAEHLSGTEKAFLKRIEAKLNDLGIQDYKLHNATGLNESKLAINASEINEENLFTADSLGLLIYHLLKEHPQITEITEKSQAPFGKETVYATNRLVPNMPRFRNGVDGLKSGTSTEYGESVVISTNEKGMRLVAILLSVDNPNQDPNARYNAGISLLNYITRTFYANVLAAEGESYMNSRAVIKDGKQSPAPAVAKSDAILVQRIDSTKEAKISWETNPKGYQAPIKKGDFLGNLTYSDPEPIGKGYIQGTEPKFPMVSKEAVQKSNFLKVMWNNFVLYVNEKL